MSKPFTTEVQMEMTLIRQLESGISQWTYRDDLRTEEDLWNNLREKLNFKNKDVLNEVPLTDKEFAQVKNQLQFPTYYDAAKWLVGENGVVKFKIVREDASLGTIFLVALKRADIAGGSSSYEVINQYQSVKQNAEDLNRRFDVSLLINGIPLIHIELKNRQHPYMDAFNQIRKYLKEGKFRGIFSCLQMFVVSNGTDTRYIASATATKINPQFLTTWVDKDNNPVNHYLDFADHVLSIPMAHKMVTQYTVVDNERNSLILLRPYQIHAIEECRNASKQQKSGYVWHTTGSGKTLTSYKVARNLLEIPGIDKTIFIVDRVDLDQQTTSSFTSYAENDVIDIDETDNVYDLTKKLLSQDRSVIVTTIQKLNIVMRKNPKTEENRRARKLAGLKIAFVVDECHRAVTPEKKQQIERYFNHSLWYGFTGTPIFAENARKSSGDLPSTTEELYGERLHQYTVKEAIHDKAVLGFQVEYKSTFGKDMIDDIVRQQTKDKNTDIREMVQEEKEAYILKNYYENDEHLLKVLDSIINKSRAKLGFDNGVGRTYEGMLTASSIPLAQRYYELIKQIKDGKSKVVISERVKQVLPDFPKVAITYSITENEHDSIVNQEKMKASLRDYNEMFGTNFTMENIKGYNLDVNKRLARKQERYMARSEQLDLVIVVDRLLTGFDAPCLSTLFIDRKPMKPHHLIQAFSRTNRIFDAHKKYGQIVTFQTPTIFEEKVKEALVLYSNGGENYVLAPSWEEASGNLLEAIKHLRAVTPAPEDIDLNSMAIVKKFAKAYQKFDKAFGNIQVYSEYDEGLMGGFFPMVVKEIESYHGKYVNAIEIIRQEQRTGGEDDELIDVEYELESIKTEEINYEYILMLIQSFVPSGNDLYELVPDHDEKAVKEVDSYLKDLARTNPRLAKIIEDLWTRIQNDPESYRDQNISEILENIVSEKERELIDGFADKWNLNPVHVYFVLMNYSPKNEKQIGQQQMFDASNYKAYKAKAESKGEKPVSGLKYRRAVMDDLVEFMLNEIKPLRNG